MDGGAEGDKYCENSKTDKSKYYKRSLSKCHKGFKEEAILVSCR